MHIKENWTDIGFIVLMVPVLNWMIFLMHDFEEFKKYNKKPSDLTLRLAWSQGLEIPEERTAC